jgi:hypothetical protein
MHLLAHPVLPVQIFLRVRLNSMRKYLDSPRRSGKCAQGLRQASSALLRQRPSEVSERDPSNTSQLQVFLCFPCFPSPFPSPDLSSGLRCPKPVADIAFPNFHTCCTVIEY